MRDLAEYTATELLAGYVSGDFTPVEATEATLERIEQRNTGINAFVRVEAETALHAARDSTRRWQDGAPLGPGDGIPTSIKDIFLTQGLPTLRGSQLIDEAGSWDVSAPCVQRLTETGAVILGKTTTPEFAWKGVTDSARYGATTNPWNTECHAGGSSGGSAAAVAAGMGPWSVGTDGGGSVRIPASFTGTVALKPTYGLVPMYPSSPFGTLAHAGPMTRTVADTALLLDVITQPDPRDWSALATPQGSFTENLQSGVKGLRIAYSPDLGFGTTDPQVRQVTDAAVELLASEGAIVEAVDPGFVDPIEAFEVLWFTGAGKVLEAYGDDALTQIDPGLREGIERYRNASAQDYLSATAVRMNMGTMMGEFHQTYDLLITPTMPMTSFDASRQAPEGWPGKLWTNWTPYTYPFNMTQQPAVSVPCGVAENGLPVGLQIIGARHDDARVLQAAYAYEQAAGGKFIRPVSA